MNKMTEAMEFHDSDVAAVEIANGALRIEFSEAYIWAEKKGWGQRAILTLEKGKVLGQPLKFPVTISEGLLKSHKEQFNNIVPLPFSKTGKFSGDFSFTNGEVLKVIGQNPRVELEGKRRFIEDTWEL